MLTQFNSASLNRHIAQTYRLDLFSKGFVDILAAEQTADSSHWFQGTADAVRQAARHFVAYDADYYLILAGDHLYRMDFDELVEAHIDGNADITIAAKPVSVEDASSMGIFRFDLHGRRGLRGEARRRAARRDWREHSVRRGVRHERRRLPVRRVDGDLRVLARDPARSHRDAARRGLRPGDHPGGAQPPPRARLLLPRLLGRRRDGEVVLRGEHPAHAAGRAVQLLPPAAPHLHAPALPAGFEVLRLPDRGFHGG